MSAARFSWHEVDEALEAIERFFVESADYFQSSVPIGPGGPEVMPPLQLPCERNEVVADPGLHKHICPTCSTSWKHSNALPRLCPSEEVLRQAHTCPKCGTEEYGRAW